MLHREPSIEKVAAAIGWRPTRSLEQTLVDVVEHTKHAPVTVEAAALD
jgi:nucleoside-diphosphate-sugar epimerase